MEELRELAEEAKDAGLAVVVWSYPRGPALDKAAETAVDICAYAAHMAALLGAHIIKVKPPTERGQPRSRQEDLPDPEHRHLHPGGPGPARGAGCFAGRRIVVFSGGEAQDDLNAIFEEIRGLRDGGANGSIIGRNTFQRPEPEALKMLETIIGIYQGK